MFKKHFEYVADASHYLLFETPGAWNESVPRRTLYIHMYPTQKVPSISGLNVLCFFILLFLLLLQRQFRSVIVCSFQTFQQRRVAMMIHRMQPIRVEITFVCFAYKLQARLDVVAQEDCITVCTKFQLPHKKILENAPSWHYYH